MCVTYNFYVFIKLLNVSVNETTKKFAEFKENFKELHFNMKLLGTQFKIINSAFTFSIHIKQV